MKIKHVEAPGLQVKISDIPISGTFVFGEYNKSNEQVFMRINNGDYGNIRIVRLLDGQCFTDDTNRLVTKVNCTLEVSRDGG